MSFATSNWEFEPIPKSLMLHYLANSSLSVSPMLPFQLPHPASRRPVTTEIVVTEILPLILLYHATALLVTLRNTLFLRLAFLPITIWLAFKAGTTIMVDNPVLNHVNYGFIIVLLVMVMRVVEWSIRMEPYHRKANRSEDNRSSLQILSDVMDLSFNLRGVGWSWGQSCPTIQDSPITSSFLLDTCLRLLASLTAFDVLHASLSTFPSLGTLQGGSIFDPSLSFPLRYAKSSIITFITGMCIFTSINTLYHVATLLGIVVFRQDRESWPAIFNSPFATTSLTDFWGRRWHQLFRRNFVVIGGKPLHYLFGKLGGVIGIFLISGILHDWGMWGMAQGTEFETVGGYFLAQSFGIIIEGILQNLLGKNVSGTRGKIWTITWVVACANPMVDAWLRRGLAGCMFLPDAIRPTFWLKSFLS